MTFSHRPPSFPSLVPPRPTPKIVAEVEAWLAGHPGPRPSRPEALRHVLRSRLVELGLVRSRAEPSPT